MNWSQFWWESIWGHVVPVDLVLPNKLPFYWLSMHKGFSPLNNKMMIIESSHPQCREGPSRRTSALVQSFYDQIHLYEAESGIKSCQNMLKLLKTPQSAIMSLSSVDTSKPTKVSSDLCGEIWQGSGVVESISGLFELCFGSITLFCVCEDMNLR